MEHTTLPMMLIPMFALGFGGWGAALGYRLRGPAPGAPLPWTALNTTYAAYLVPATWAAIVGFGLAWFYLLSARTLLRIDGLNWQWWTSVGICVLCFRCGVASIVGAKAAHAARTPVILSGAGLWTFPLERLIVAPRSRAGGAWWAPVADWLGAMAAWESRYRVQTTALRMRKALDAALGNTGAASRTLRWTEHVTVKGPDGKPMSKPLKFERRVRTAFVDCDVVTADDCTWATFRLRAPSGFDVNAHSAWSSVAQVASAVLNVPQEAVTWDAARGELRVLLLAPPPAAPPGTEPEPEPEEREEDLSPLAPGLPPLDLLPAARRGRGRPNEGKTAAARVIQALAALGAPGAEAVSADVGPSAVAVTVRPPQSVRGSHVLRMREDLAIELAAPGLRVAPSPSHPGCVLVEVPRGAQDHVALRSVAASPEFRGAKGALPVAFGVDTAGRPVVADLAGLPHLLVAGATGSGKTVALHALIVSLLLRRTPEELRLLLVDPKVVEFPAYEGLPHLLAPCVTEVPAVLAALRWLAGEMDRRYKALAAAGAQDVAAYNDQAGRALPRIVAVFDETADVMLAGKKDQREGTQRTLARLLAKARAAGIHMVLATQRPTVDVLPGLVKANAPARLALAVQSELDSRIILDRPGAEALAGKGDALLLLPGAREPARVQAPYCPREVAESVVDWWRARRTAAYDPGLLGALAAAGMDVPELQPATAPAPVAASAPSGPAPGPGRPPGPGEDVEIGDGDDGWSPDDE